jgi:hypothetical protein
MLVRGPATGAAELVEYYHFFLEGHERGEISQYTADQNLAAFVNRMTRQQADAAHASYIYLPTSERTAQRIYRVLWAAVLLTFLARLALLRIRRAPLSAFELCLVFLAGLLLSPITFMAHLVSLLFVYSTFLSVRWNRLSPTGRVAGAVLVVAMAVTGLSGRDLAGSAVYEAVGGYSIFVWTMLLMFVSAVALAGPESKPGAAVPP